MSRSILVNRGDRRTALASFDLLDDNLSLPAHGGSPRRPVQPRRKCMRDRPYRGGAPPENGPGTATLPAELASGDDTLPLDRCLELHRLMVRTRVMEERCIKMSKSGEAYFWVGGPGEEAFNVALGLQVRRGFGPAHDYLHLHYRNPGLMLALGMPVLDHVRQMAMTRTDPYSMGRNFVCHYSKKDWNVI